AATGSSTGRGTPSSPFAFCGTDWFAVAHYGDLVQLRNGTYPCDGFIALRGGVTVRGETKPSTVVTGVNGRNDTFRGFTASGERSIGTAAIENLTITSADVQAVSVRDFGGLAV